MSPSTNESGDGRVADPVSPNSLLLGLHSRLDGFDDRMDEQDKALAKIMRFFEGDNAQGNDGAVSRINAHSKDIGEVKDELAWVRRGVIAAMAGIALTVAGWGLSKVADAQANAQPTHK